MLRLRWVQWVRWVLRRHQEVSEGVVERLSRIIRGWRPVGFKEESSLRVTELEEGLSRVLGERRGLFVGGRLIKRERRRLILRERGRSIERVRRWEARVRRRLMIGMWRRLIMSER